MAILASILNVVGVLFLAHAVYSSYEHSLRDDLALSVSTSAPVTQTHSPLPVDIVVEALVSVLLICIGVVLTSAQLKPIQWSAWAGQLERSKEARSVTAFGEGGGNPYARLEDRIGFLDVRKGRTLKR